MISLQEHGIESQHQRQNSSWAWRKDAASCSIAGPHLGSDFVCRASTATQLGYICRALISYMSSIVKAFARIQHISLGEKEPRRVSLHALKPFWDEQVRNMHARIDTCLLDPSRCVKNSLYISTVDRIAQPHTRPAPSHKTLPSASDQRNAAGSPTACYVLPSGISSS